MEAADIAHSRGRKKSLAKADRTEMVATARLEFDAISRQSAFNRLIDTETLTVIILAVAICAVATPFLLASLRFRAFLVLSAPLAVLAVFLLIAFFASRAANYYATRLARSLKDLQAEDDAE